MKQDVIIVGAGIIGLATAEHLLRLGLKVLLLEQRKIGQESSWAGGGILSPLMPWHYSEAVTRLTRYSANLFSEWSSTLHTLTGIDPEYSQCGMIILPPYDIKTALHWCSKNDIKINQLKLSQYISFKRNETIKQCDNTQRAILLPDIAQIRPPKLLQALHQRVIQLGGKIIENCTVQHLIVKQNSVQTLQTSSGQFAANHYVITAGAWSAKILGQYTLRFTVKPICGQMLLFKFESPPIPTILILGGTYLIPRKDGYLLVGSTSEDKGFNKQVTISARRQLLKTALTILPQLYKMPIIRQWSGLRPASPQNIPTIDQHPNLTNLYINSGHFRYGVTMAPASAEILTNIINGTPQPFDVNSYRY
ncbi:MAG: glycine oxidase ThiO [Burkholderiales bacterium]|uniref:glycine oxidase ThiO n=1 Tax=Nitrosomonas sp. TaxID=42353 RepID=UPI001DEA477F|nr:glycine oxidase ThiO [Nitrosomonas sp.]MCB1948197.1 glycine oxidase ThiO [Nitrosomonas sp.]MCP5243404.1 glycine oxidase ThiO [Burkholderiales bacterium]